MEIISTKLAPAAIGPYSQAIHADGRIYVSGQIGLVPETGEMAGNDFESQAKQALANLGAIIKASNCELSQIVAVDVFLTDMKNFTIFNGMYETFFAGHRPARAVVEVSGLPRGALVEIKCIACCS